MDSLHHDPDQWIKHDDYIPERFDPESPYFKRPDGGPRHPMAFGPFLGGQRVCLGKTFAELMVRYTISILMWHYDFKPKENTHPHMNIMGLIKPDIRCTKTLRNPLPAEK